MGKIKSLFADFSGFVGEDITVLHNFGDEINNWKPQIKGKVKGVLVDEYIHDDLTRTTLTLFIGNIPSEDVLSTNIDKAIYRANKNAMIPFKISWQNGEIWEKFLKDDSRTRIILE